MKKFYGQFAPPVDRFIFERYFPDENITGTFVECGAYDGQTECSCKFFEESMGWKGYNLEPVPWIYEQLCSNRPNSTNLNFALSNIAAKKTFKAVDHPQYGINCTNGSLTHTPEHTAWLQEIGCQVIDISVSLFTWRDFIEQENIQYVDLLVLDVEGHELHVIEGMKGSSVLPDVICIEIGHLSFDSVREKLGNIGYIYDISSHVNAYFIKKNLLALFALRRADLTNTMNSLVSNQTEMAIKNQITINTYENQLTKLVSDNQSITHCNESLERLLQEIKGSKGWKFVETIRRLKGKFLARSR